MKNLILSSVLVLVASAAAQAQQAVQWRVEDGGNGHWYACRSTVGSGEIWSSSSVVAEQLGGHLATLTSAAENSWVYQLSVAQSAWRGRNGPLLGGYKLPNNTFRWVTDEPWGFTAWLVGEPNSGLWEPYLQFLGPQFTSNSSATWNDCDAINPTDQPWHFYIIEWSADCNADGIVDYGQCRDGSLPDYNGNNIPDCCEAGTPCVVGNFPVQWRVETGGNGHWYVISAGYSGWAAARGDALSVGADLASMETNPEWLWVRSWLPSILHGYWLGARQTPNSPTPSAGWRWLTGGPVAEEWMVMDDNPCGSSTPDVEDMQQDFLHTCCDAYPQGRSWGDLDDLGGWGCDITLRALLEWSADCNNDGIVDYGQILQGQLIDADANGVPDVCQVDPCPGDITNGGTVDATDLSIVLAAWGTNGQGEFQADIDGSALVDGGDLALVLGGWGPCPQ